MVDVVCISDTHTHSLPGILCKGLRGNDPITADILLIAGDWSYRGTKQEQEMFEEDLIKIRPQFKDIVWINGNHEVGVERKTGRSKIANGIAFRTKTHYLENQAIEVQGIKVWGSPVTPTFGFGWAWNVDRGNDIMKIWDLIPEGIDILMTHGLVYGHGDVVRTRHWDENSDLEHVGCWDLAQAVKRVKPKIFVGGHLHRTIEVPERYTKCFDGTTTYYNASICDDNYKPTNSPVMFTL